MMQDSHSRLWLGTIDDVQCFDGAHFFSLRQYGFPKEVPNAFAEDSDGGIWIATQGTDVGGGKNPGGLYRYQSGHVEKIATGDGLGVESVAPGIMLAALGTELEGRPSFGDLVRFRNTSGAWIAERVAEKKADHLTVDAQGNLLFPCPAGWCELSRQQIVDWPGPGTPIAIAEHPGNPLVERVLRDRFGCMWFRAEAFASYQCPGMPSMAQMPQTISKFDDSAHLEEAPDGSIFMLVSMTLGRPGAFQTAKIRNGLPPDMDTAMVAKDGTIWIGTGSGLYRFMYPFRMEYWDQNNGVESPYGILRVDGKTFATSTGVATLSDDRGYWSTLPGTAILNGSNSLMAGPNGTIFATTGSGVAQLRLNGEIVARSGFADRGVSLAKTKDGQIWMGADLGGRGINRVSRQGNRLVLTREDLPNERGQDVEYDEKRDTLWACDGKELVFRKNGSWQRITAKDGLLDFDCHVFAILPSGDVWLGYRHSPFAVIKEGTSGHPIIRNFTNDLNELIPNDSTDFLNVDRRGWLWRGTYVDFVATPQAAEAGEWLRLDKQDGIADGPANTRAFFSDADGSVWFSNNSTITHFSPDEHFATDFPAPPIFVSAFSIGKSGAMLAETLAGIPHRQEIVAHIGSLQFDRRNALRLRYRLLPEQTAWQSASGFDIDLGKLHWGNHTLEVQGQLSTGPWSETATKTFTVLKPIWLTWPALLGLVFTCGIGAAGAVQWKKRRAAMAAKKLPELAEWRVAALSPELFELDGALLDGRFEVGRVLARGGFATVAEGRDLQEAGRPCAIKIFRSDLMDNEWMTRRFQQEVLALEKIHHPNVVGIYGHGSTPKGSLYLVMEFVDGQTLRELLTPGGLTPQQAASYLLQTGGALAEIHARGICHRDLKPENLMIRHAAAAGQELVLIDFSIAIVQDPDQTLHGLSRAAGTLYYMAPEQSIGFADSSTDIYSLAKIVIEMLTGKRLSELLPDASMDLPERVRELLGGLQVNLSTASIELMSSALEFDPSRRPKRASEFATQIATDLAAVAETK